MTIDLDALRAVAAGARAISQPIRTITVTVRTRTWSGGRKGVGSSSDSDLVLASHYKVREVSSKLVASSGGLYEMGDVRVGPITPSHTGGGYTKAQLAPSGGKAVEILYVLSGDIEGDYKLVDLDTSKPFGWVMTIRRSRQ